LTDRGQKFLTEEYFPEERRDQYIFRGKKVGRPLCNALTLITQVIIECQKHHDYQASLR
jgi:Family of unknown function (DUF5923)